MIPLDPACAATLPCTSLLPADRFLINVTIATTRTGSMAETHLWGLQGALVVLSGGTPT